MVTIFQRKLALIELLDYLHDAHVDHHHDYERDGDDLSGSHMLALVLAAKQRQTKKTLAK